MKMRQLKKALKEMYFQPGGVLLIVPKAKSQVRVIVDTLRAMPLDCPIGILPPGTKVGRRIRKCRRIRK